MGKLNEEEIQEYEYELIVTKQMFYNEEGMWGAFAFKFANGVDAQTSGIKLNPDWHNFVITGNTAQLTPGEKYTIAFKDSYTDRYGKGYTFTEVKSNGLKTRGAQIEFLKFATTEKIANQIDEMFPDNNNLLSEISSGEIDLTQIKGVGDKNVQGYLEKIQEYSKYQDAIVMLSPLGVGIPMVQKMVDHFGGALALKQILENNVYKLTEMNGFGFVRVDEFAIKLGYDPNSKERLTAGAKFVLEQMSNYGDIKIPIEDFDKDMCKALKVSEITDEVFEVILENDSFYYKDGYISLSKLRREEQYIAEKTKKLLEKVEKIEGIEEKTAEIIENNEKRFGFTMNKEQRQAVELVTQQGVTIINGSAGSGKTFSVKTIVDIFTAMGMTPVAFALSGKAANVLIQNGIDNAGTIHRKLGWEGSGKFRFNAKKTLPNELIILDEASMVNNTLFVHILEAIEEGSRFLIVGDNGQLPPIGHGAVFETMLKLSVPRVELTKVHRQAQKSGILTVANEIRRGQQINGYGQTGAQVIGDLKDMRVFNYIDKKMIYDDILSTVARFRDNPNTNNKDLQVIAAMKKGDLGVPALNKGIQELLNPHPEFGEEKPFVMVKGKQLRKGDRVIQNGNFYDAILFESMEDYKGHVNLKETPYDKTAVFNGSIGYIVDITEDRANKIGGVLVEFDTFAGQELVFYHNDGDTIEVGQLDLAYAITCHRSQGSGFKTVLFAFDYSAFMLLSKEFVYTGITRAIENCLMFVDNTALHYAVKKTHSGNRKTYLQEFYESTVNTN